MKLRKACMPICAALLLSGCGGGQAQLPVAISRCDAVIEPNGVTIVAKLRSDASKPIRGVRVGVDFYQNFRYIHLTGGATLARELDPGQTQDVTLSVEKRGNVKVQGNAMRCYSTHIDYLDGTTADLPAQSYDTH